MGYEYIDIIEKLGKKGSVLGTETMENLLERLGHPEDEIRIIHAAGTNGKGSTLAFLAGILMESGYRVGRYISPTITCYEERFQINDSYISEGELETYFHRIMEVSDAMDKEGRNTPTLFEVETAIAFLYFQEKQVDYALIEVGMGGLTDATNAIRHPVLSLITSISEDHKAFLGNTVEDIAKQKAGILKEGTPAILAVNEEKIREIFREASKDAHTTCEMIDWNDSIIIEETPTGSRFLWQDREYEIALPGKHQVENSMTALHAAQKLKSLPSGDKITEESMRMGLKNTRWPGRLELLCKNPPFYLDGAHNPDGARKLAGFLEKHFTNKRIIYIMGVLGDKDYPVMLSYLMPLADRVYTFTPANSRGLDGSVLAEEIKHFKVPVTVCKDVNSAVEQAIKKEADCYVLCGSLSFMEEFRKEYGYKFEK